MALKRLVELTELDISIGMGTLAGVDEQSVVDTLANVAVLIARVVVSDGVISGAFGSDAKDGDDRMGRVGTEVTVSVELVSVSL